MLNLNPANITAARGKKSAHVRGRSSSRSPQNQENEAKAPNNNVRKTVEGEDFYHDAKIIGGLEKASSSAIAKARRCRLPFFGSERIRRHLADLILAECSLVRRQGWSDSVVNAGTWGTKVDWRLSVLDNQVHRNRERTEVLPLILQKPLNHALPDQRLVRTQPPERLPTPWHS